MLGRLGFKLGLLGMALALPVLAADRTGSSSISGYVRSAAGVPQMGAMVEVLGTAAHNFRPAAGCVQRKSLFDLVPARAA
jgi:hypothetical protein